jgi:ABC-2 type transport system permease protein
MLAVFKRELQSYFYSPVAYVLMGFFILMSSIFFLGNLFGRIAEFNSNLSQMSILLLIILPILTMRTISEDRRNGSEVMLITSPVSLTGIVLGKYLAAFCVFMVMVVLTLAYQVVILSFGSLAVGQLIGGYIGFILLGSAFLAVGLFTSSLFESQILAAITGIVSLTVMLIMKYISGFVGGLIAQILDWFSLLSRYNDFNRGILDLSAIVYYLSFIAVFIFLTIRVIDKRRWSQG